ncbi:MAG: hypothetical protein LBI27_05460 [Clostridiales bacterium]|jgi:hypothetical protein|nr:hypothetical protein [Clostridiales bacterium]
MPKRNNYEIAEILNGNAIADYPNHGIEIYANNLTKLGFQIIIKDEVKLDVKFLHMDAVIFYAKAIPWEISNFSVETHFEKLFKIKQEIDNKGFFQSTSGRFLLAAKKQ